MSVFTITDSRVATAAPTRPYLGTSRTFRTTFIDSETTVAMAPYFGRSNAWIALSKTRFTACGSFSTIRTRNAAAAMAYSGPKTTPRISRPMRATPTTEGTMSNSEVVIASDSMSRTFSVAPSACHAESCGNRTRAKTVLNMMAVVVSRQASS